MHQSLNQFDFQGKLLSRNHWSNLKGYINEDGSVPAIVEFDPTTACNFSCPECISRDLLNRTCIDADTIKKLFTELANMGTKGIVFIGGGEPLAHKNMPKPLEWAYSLGLKIGVTTNGSLINRYLQHLAEMAEWTRVSMDAGNSETFAKYRPNRIYRSFERIISSMEDLAQIKRGILGYSFLLVERIHAGSVETNAGDIVQAAKLAREIGCDYFEVKPAVDERHHLHPFSSETKDIVNEQLLQADELSSVDFGIQVTKGVRHAMNDDTSQPKSYRRCHAAHLRTLISPDGVFPCPYWRGVNEKKLGAHDSSDISNLWKNISKRVLDTKINPSEDCDFYCIRHELNLAIQKMIDDNREDPNTLESICISDTDDVFF